MGLWHLNTPKRVLVTMFCVVFAITAGTAMADRTKKEASPVGVWKNIDDETGKPMALIRVWEHKNVLYGKVTKGLDTGKGDGICHLCKGKKKDKPIVGMQILWGLKKVNDNLWDDGYILDPNNGKTYRCKITLSPDGQTLQVRGYIGVPLLGRTQTWLREE